MKWGSITLLIISSYAIGLGSAAIGHAPRLLIPLLPMTLALVSLIWIVASSRRTATVETIAMRRRDSQRRIIVFLILGYLAALGFVTVAHYTLSPFAFAFFGSVGSLILLAWAISRHIKHVQRRVHFE